MVPRNTVLPGIYRTTGVAYQCDDNNSINFTCVSGRRVLPKIYAILLLSVVLNSSSSLLPVSYAPGNNSGTMYSGNRHYIYSAHR